MRIAQVSPLYESVPPASYGGTERVVSYLSEELVRQGHDVTLFASGDSRTQARLEPMVARALRLHAKDGDPIVPHLVMLERVDRMARAGAFDAVHYHTDYFSFPYARRLSAPSVVTIHGRLDVPDLRMMYGEFADVPLVSISDAQRRPQARANWVATVHHGLPPRLYRRGPGPRSRKGEYVVFLGRISPEKRPDLAIRIARRAGVELRIAAKVDTVDRAYFESEIRPMLSGPGVQFLGEIADREKNEFLGKALAVLFPIDWPEPFGLVMIESMACGTPVIAFPRGSVPEVIDEGVTGLIVEGVEAAAEAVHRVRGMDRGACRARYEERFTSSRMAREYVEVYESLRGPPAGRARAGREAASRGRAAARPGTRKGARTR